MIHHLISLPYRFLNVTHAARALQSVDLSGEGINLWITYILFYHTRTWRAHLDEGSAQCWGHLRDSTNMKDYTHRTHSHSNKATMKWWLWRPDDIWGLLWAKSFLTFVLSGRENPDKKKPIQETCPSRVSNTDPLRDRRACYRPFHNDGHDSSFKLNDFLESFYLKLCILTHIGLM